MDYIIIFGLKIPINNIAFTIPGTEFHVYWYGIIIAVGFLLALWWGIKQADRYGVNSERMIDVVLVGFVGAIVCARAYYVIFNTQAFTNWTDIFAIHDGGIAIYGAVIGALIFGGITCKIRKVDVLCMFDLAMPGFLIGQAVGRWGNFVNQEAYGYATGSDWFGMTGSRIAREMGEGVLVHPCFLYESLWCIGCFILLWRIGRKRAFKGQIFSLYLICYSTGRFFIEGLRTDWLPAEPLLPNVRVSQLLAALLVAGGIALYFILRDRERRSHNDQYVSQFDGDALESKITEEALTDGNTY